jgi:hypothetical protein
MSNELRSDERHRVAVNLTYTAVQFTFDIGDPRSINIQADQRYLGASYVTKTLHCDTIPFYVIESIAILFPQYLNAFVSLL